MKFLNRRRTPTLFRLCYVQLETDANTQFFKNKLVESICYIMNDPSCIMTYFGVDKLTEGRKMRFICIDKWMVVDYLESRIDITENLSKGAS